MQLQQHKACWIVNDVADMYWDINIWLTFINKENDCCNRFCLFWYVILI